MAEAPPSVTTGQRFELPSTEQLKMGEWPVSSTASHSGYPLIQAREHRAKVRAVGHRAVRLPGGPCVTVAVTAPRPELRSLERANEAIRAAIVDRTSERVTFDPEALDRAYELLVAAEPYRRRDSVCGRVSVGFPIRYEDYEDAPSED